jgi:hypothetical protein
MSGFDDDDAGRITAAGEPDLLGDEHQGGGGGDGDEGADDAERGGARSAPRPR